MSHTFEEDESDEEVPHAAHATRLANAITLGLRGAVATPPEVNRIISAKVSA
jgi:hypothetical protein